MELLVTELQKARKELLGIFRMYNNGSSIKAAGFKKQFDKAMLEEILSTGHCEFLDDVDRTGTRLMKSWHTRSTGHKNWDYTDLQSKSSPMIQQLYAEVDSVYSDLQKKEVNRDVKMVDARDAAKDSDYGEGLQPITKKLSKAKKDLLDTIKSDGTLYEKVKEQCDAIKEGAAPNQSITDTYKALCTRLRDQHVVYVDDKSGKIVKDACDLSEALFYGGYSGYVTGALESEVLIWTLPIAAMSAEAFTAAALTPIGVGAGIFALLGLASLALFVANETGVTKRLGKIMAKRYERKVNEKLTAVLKCMNEASRYAASYARKVSGQEDSVVKLGEVPKELKNVVSDFVKAFHALWSHYLSAEGKEYDSELTDEYGRHYSGLVKKQATAQKSEIGSCKLAVANICAGLECAV